MPCFFVFGLFCFLLSPFFLSVCQNADVMDDWSFCASTQRKSGYNRRQENYENGWSIVFSVEVETSFLNRLNRLF